MKSFSSRNSQRARTPLVLRKSRIDRHRKRLVKFLERYTRKCLLKLIRVVSSKLRDAMVPLAKLFVRELSPRDLETDSVDTVVFVTHIHVYNRDVPRETKTRFSIRTSHQLHVVSCESGGEGLMPKVPVRFERTFRARESPWGGRKLAPFESQVQNAPGSSRSP